MRYSWFLIADKACPNLPEYEAIPTGSRWPSGDGRPIAIIDISPEELSIHLGLTLAEGAEPGLGPWVAIGLRLQGGLDVELIQYRWSPEPRGFELRIDSEADPQLGLEEALEQLNLKARRLSWRILDA